MSISTAPLDKRSLVRSPHSPSISPWCRSRTKRALDLAVATLALVASAPIMVLVAMLVKVSSRGPVLFRHTRCGQDDKRIAVLKFRTMIQQAENAGPGVTRGGDSRITGVGRMLRKCKLDELPQLLNVIRGDMSLVGPRPDSPEYLAHLPERLRGLIQLRPGITGWATIKYRNEEDLLSVVPAAELENYYVRTVLPRKARLDLAYAQRATLCSDLRLLIRTCRAVTLGSNEARHRATPTNKIARTARVSSTL